MAAGQRASLAVVARVALFPPLVVPRRGRTPKAGGGEVFGKGRRRPLGPSGDCG